MPVSLILTDNESGEISPLTASLIRLYFAVTSALRQANKFSYPMLVKALNSCIEVDYNARSGGTKLEIEIERLIITRAGTM